MLFAMWLCIVVGVLGMIVGFTDEPVCVLFSAIILSFAWVIGWEISFEKDIENPNHTKIEIVKIYKEVYSDSDGMFYLSEDMSKVRLESFENQSTEPTFIEVKRYIEIETGDVMKVERKLYANFK